MRRRIIPLVLVLVICMSFFHAGASAATFNDVSESHWAYDAVEYLYRNGFVVPLGDGGFKPDSFTTRAEMSVLICRAMGITTPEKSPTAPVSDIIPLSWYADYANHAVAEGWMAPDENGLFNPHANLTRQELSLAAAHVVDAYDPNDDYSSYVNGYGDVGDIGGEYINTVGFLSFVNIIAGDGNGLFRPAAPANRAEMAVILYRVMTFAEPDDETYTVTLTINKDGMPWPDHGKPFELWDNVTGLTYNGVKNGNTVTFTGLSNGLYMVADGPVTVGILVDDGNEAETLDYYTVSYAVVAAGEATGGGIEARYGDVSIPIQSGDVVFGGFPLVLTAAGSGANFYSFIWNDVANTTSPTLAIERLRATVNLSCTVTGSASRVTALSIATQPDKLTYYEGTSLQLTGLTVDLTLNDGFSDTAITGVPYQDFNKYGILATVDGDLFTQGLRAKPGYHGKPIILSTGSVTAETDPITMLYIVIYYSSFPTGSGLAREGYADSAQFGEDYVFPANMFSIPVGYKFDAWQHNWDGPYYRPGDVYSRDVFGSGDFYTRWRRDDPSKILEVTPAVWDAPATAASNTVTVTSDTTRIVSSSAAWLKVSPAYATGSGPLTLTVDANTGAARTGIVTITAGAHEKTVVVTQAPAGTSIPITSVTLDDFVAPVAGQTPVAVGALNTADIGYTVASIAWSPAAAAFGYDTVYSATVELTAKAGYTFAGGITPVVNTGTPSIATVTDGGDGLRFTVAFPATGTDPGFSVSPASWSPTAAAASTTVTVVADTSWTASSNAAWLTVSPANGANNGTLTLTVASNSGSARTGTVTVKAGTLEKTITVTQESGGGGGGGGGGTAPPTEVVPSPETPQTPIFPFVDVLEGDWCYTDVYYGWINKLFYGTTETTFSPNMSITRGMIVTVLYRMAGSPDAAGLSNPFDDVPDGQYYTNAVKWAAANDIVLGWNGRYRPEENVTRQEFVTILARYADYADRELPETQESPVFRDAADIANYAKDAVERFFKASVVNGKSNDRFDPKGSTTRAEAAAMLHRFLEVTTESETTAEP